MIPNAAAERTKGVPVGFKRIIPGTLVTDPFGVDILRSNNVSAMYLTLFYGT